jgi:hypothetical protein
MANWNLVPIEYLVNWNSHLSFRFEGKIKFIAVTYLGQCNTNIIHSICASSSNEAKLSKANIVLWVMFTGILFKANSASVNKPLK